MLRNDRPAQSARAPALTEYCNQMRFRAMARARIASERAARREAQAAAEIKSNFISMMSHELRTPLNSIIGFSEILAQPETFLSEAERTNYAELINSSGRHLTAVLNGILEMSKIQSGTYELALADANLVEVVEEVVATMQVVADKAGISLVRQWEAEEVIAQVDDTRLLQCVRNVVDNAIKFTRRGGTVSVDCRVDEDGHAVVTVADTGVGMDDDELARALTPFGQVRQGLDGEGGGTGLGLCIARDLTHLQRGEFAIRSAKGRGTTLTFSFAAHEAAGGGKEWHAALLPHDRADVHV